MTIQRRTKQVQAVSEALQAAQRPLSIDELHQMAQKSVPSLGIRTVYRAVRRLEDQGEVGRVSVPGQSDRYELACVASVHHHHFHCTKCDRFFDVNGCPGGFNKLVPAGFKLKSHELTLFGLCNACG